MPKPSTLDPAKELMVKTKTLQRLMKEASYYKKEVEENQAKLDKMKADGKDEYDIKKFAEVLDESIMMVPDSENRKMAALQDLKIFIEKNEDILDADGDWMKTAKSLLNELSA